MPKDFFFIEAIVGLKLWLSNVAAGAALWSLLYIHNLFIASVWAKVLETLHVVKEIKIKERCLKRPLMS